MAISFNKVKGEAQKSSANSYKYVDGNNKVRLVGGVLPRYVYWIKGENDKNIPLECLSFDRDKEAFVNIEKDHIRDYYPDLKCTWSYMMQCLVDGELKNLNLKKKLWEQIHTAAEDLGDPTDPTTGWDIQFKREKTGPLNYNIEYTLQSLKCKPRPLTEAELAIVKEMRPIDEVMARPTPDAQKELLDRLAGAAVKVDESIDEDFDIK